MAGIGQFAVIQSVARSVGVEASPLNLRDAGEIERAVTAFASSNNGGLIVAASAIASVQRNLIIELAARHRLPAVYFDRHFVAGGGLISYGADFVDQCRRAVGYVDRILKGEKPADMPVQAPTNPVKEQNLKAHSAYMGDLYAQRQVALGGLFVDDAGGGFAFVRAKDRGEATALLAADPAIREGVFTGVVRPCHAVFNEPEDTGAALSQARANKHAVRALFEAVDRRDGEGVRASYGENITIHEAASLPYGGDYHGLEGALRHGQGFRAAWDRFQQYETRGLDPQIVADGDHVVVLWQHKVESVETGDRLELPAVSVYRMKNARIADSRMFHFDTAALLCFLERNVVNPASHMPGYLR